MGIVEKREIKGISIDHNDGSALGMGGKGRLISGLVTKSMLVLFSR